METLNEIGAGLFCLYVIVGAVHIRAKWGGHG